MLRRGRVRALAEATGGAFEPLAPPAAGSVASRGRRRRTTTACSSIYTSGTTGRPKGAVLTHANCFWTNLSFDLATGLTGDDVVLQVLPQFHCGGWNVQPLLAWWKGGKVVLERSFEPARVLALLEEKRVTTLMGVPAIYLFLSQEPAFADADLSSLRLAVVGGAPMPEELIRVWQERGIEIVQGYGLTEASPNVLCLPPEDAIRKMGSAGKPYPFVERRGSATGASCRFAGRTSFRATGGMLRRLPRCSATAGCTRATSPRPTTMATTGFAAA